MTTQSGVDVVERARELASLSRNWLANVGRATSGEIADMLEAQAAEIIALRSRVAEAERVGIERAAKWHDDEVERIIPLKPRGCSPSIWMRAIRDHEECAKAIRSLSAAPEPGHGATANQQKDPAR